MCVYIFLSSPNKCLIIFLWTQTSFSWRLIAIYATFFVVGFLFASVNFPFFLTSLCRLDYATAFFILFLCARNCLFNIFSSFILDIKTNATFFQSHKTKRLQTRCKSIRYIHVYGILVCVLYALCWPHSKLLIISFLCASNE